jgi:hypothetical protein
MRNRSRATPWLAVGALLWLGACGAEDAPGAPGEDEDAEVPLDAGDEDAEVDGGADADVPQPDGGQLSQCKGDVLEFPAANAPGRPFSAAQSGNRTHLVYLVAAGGGSLGSSTAQGLRYVSFATTGEPSDAQDVANVGTASYAKTRDPALVARGAAVDLFYTSNQDGPYELYHKDLTKDDATAERETSNVDRNEFTSAAASLDGELAVVYSDEPPQLGAAGALAFKFAGEEALEVTPESFGIRATELAFAELSGVAAAAFVSEREDNAGIYLQALSTAGEVRGEAVALSEEVGSASGVDLARGQSGAAVVYTEAPSGPIHQLRFRNIDGDGQPSGPVRLLTSANQDLLEVALAAYSQGYVIAYRRIGGPASAAASIHLMFVDAEGNVGGTRLVRSATSSGRGIDVMVGNDGRLIVIWADTEQVTDPGTQRQETELRVRAARVLCAL